MSTTVLWADDEVRESESTPRTGGHDWWGTAWFALGTICGAHLLSDNSFLTHLATGRQILDGNPEVRIHGRSLLVRARIAQIEGVSGHADHDGLLRWLGRAMPVFRYRPPDQARP